jgi:hypothetical protein
MAACFHTLYGYRAQVPIFSYHAIEHIHLVMYTFPTCFVLPSCPPAYLPLSLLIAVANILVLDAYDSQNVSTTQERRLNKSGFGLVQDQVTAA